MGPDGLLGRAALVSSACLVVLAAGCSRSSKPSSSEAAGQYGVTFKVNVSRPVGGTITSVGASGPDGRIDCGTKGGTANACAEASYPWSQPATFVATPDPGFRFVGWAADCTGTAPTCTVDTKSGGADKWIAAAFETAAWSPGVAFLVTVARPTGGTVTSEDGRIRCGTAANANACGPVLFRWSETATLTATPDTGFTFEGWGGDCSGTGTCALSTTSQATDKDVTARFAMQVGAEGGTLQSATGVSLSFPAAAVTELTRISVSVATDAPPVPATVTLLSPIYEFGPDGLGFASPVTVILPVPDGTTDATVYWTTPDGTAFEDIGGVVSGNTIQAEVWHFSKGFAGGRHYAIGGSVTGLTGTGLVLQDNGGDDLAVVVPGPFTFSTKLASGTTYAVSVAQQPTDQTCTIANATGVVGNARVNGITVTCADNTYPVSGSASGVVGSGLVLTNTFASGPAEDVAVAADGSFSFAIPGQAGSLYGVTVKSQPSSPWQTCSVVGGSGVLSGPVTTVTVICTTNTYLVGGTVSGLAGAGLVLGMTGEPDVAVAAGASSFAFASPLASGTAYGVTVVAQPLGQTCVVSNASGTIAGAAVTDVGVSCTPNTYSVGGTISGLTAQGLVLATPGEPNLAVPAGATAFSFSTPLAMGTRFAVTVATQPQRLVCTVSNGTGVVGARDVTSIAVSCLPGSFTPTGSMTASRIGHTVTLMPNGLVLVAGGVGPLASAELYDPATGTFTPTGSMRHPRAYATATLLPSGLVFITGGTTTGDVSTPTAELYDPASGTFTDTGVMVGARSRHTATLLPNGLVLIAGGVNYTSSGGGTSVWGLELYDLATGAFAAAGSLNVWRMDHTATVLPTGLVLIAGGDYDQQGSAELFDPATRRCTFTGRMSVARQGHSATLLPNGLVLVAGGSTGARWEVSADLYDPSTGAFTATGSMITARYGHSATLLPNGSVLITSGSNSSVASEVYDTGSGTFGLTASTGTVRWGIVTRAVLLPTGVVLVAGGASNTGGATAEIYTPAGNGSASGTFVTTGSLLQARSEHSATLLPSGKVLIAGGYDGASLSAAELYDPATGTFAATGAMATPRFRHTATLLPNGTVLVTGGYGASGVVASAELYDPRTGTFVATGSMHEPRSEHRATLLPNGRVLITGGGQFFSSYTAEIYDPSSGTFTTTGSMMGARAGHSATLLPNGLVLVAGGVSNVVVATAELYDPATGSFAPAGSMTSTRYQQTATLLPDGNVLVSGGTDAATNYLATAEIYHPASRAFAATGAMANTREYHGSTLLPGGAVLVAGGYASGQNRAELYDARTGNFTATGGLGASRARHTMTLLPDGRVLVAGGGDEPATAELYVP